MEWLKALAGVVLGVVLTRLLMRLDRLNRVSANRESLRAEILNCERKARTYSEDRVKSPSYRLPTARFDTSMAVLIDGAGLTGEQIQAVQEFYDIVFALNRGLEQANDARGDSAILDVEFKRNLIKAQGLMASAPAALGALEPRRRWWQMRKREES